MFTAAKHGDASKWEQMEPLNDTGDDHPLLEESSISYRSQNTNTALWKRILPWLAHVVLLSTSIFLFVLKPTCSNRCLETSFPLTGNHAFDKMTRFRGNLEFDSPFKGPPSSAVDQAWEAILPISAISIPEDMFAKLNASKHAVKLPQSAGGGYMGFVEGFHLLHCLKSLWETTYPSYYTDHHTFSIEHPSEWHAHLDHCTDILRQKLMCDADANLITYNWIKNHYSPKPNFNVQHRCRNYQKLLDIAAQLKADGSQFEEGKFVRPTDQPVVDFVEPPFDPEADA